MNKKKIAVVGAGLFGCTIALILSKKYNVDLYERKPDILNEASMCNQFRFHLGFHYPRSEKTVNEIRISNKHFVNFYGKDVFGKTKNFYRFQFLLVEQVILVKTLYQNLREVSF